MTKTVDYYLRAASEYDAKARAARDPETRWEYEDLARVYREVAEHSPKKMNVGKYASAEKGVRNVWKIR